MRTPEEYNRAIQDKLKEAMEGKHSVITGKRKSLHISNIGFGELPDTDDYARQKQLLLNKETEGVNMYGNVSLVDNKTGQILDNNPNAKLGFVPTITNRFSNIIGGKEYIVHNQFRLRPAIYTKLDRLGQAQADFNLAKGKNLSISYQPAKEQMMVKVGTHNLPLYTYLKDVYKVPDKELIQTFGPEMHMQEMAKYQPKREQLLSKLHETYFGKKPDIEVGSIGAKIKEQLDKTEMDAATNMRTLGQAYSKVNDKALLHAASDVLEIYKGNKQPTWKDNIAYKSVHSIEDFLHERLAKPKPVMEIHNRLIPRIDRANKVSEAGAGQVFKKNILDFFKDSNLVNYPQQVNPMEFLENAHKITSLGEGGVSDTNELPIDARNLHFSQAGFVDPVRTPDDLKAGIDLRITLPTWKDKDVLKTAAIDKNGKRVIVSHTDMFDKTYAIDTEPEQPNGLYRAFHKGKIVEVPKSKIELWLPNESMFTVTSAAIPFIKNNQGQRVAMGAKMTTQALSLVHREKPLVDTYANQIMAGFYTPKAKAAGTIVNITKDNIHIQDEAGKIHNHNIPNNMPLNYHSYLHVDPMVKVGEKVTKGQLLGDNNFTVSGANALGVNATVAYMPLHGYNYEDGFAISQTGAEKMSSNHVFTEEMDLTNSATIPDEKKYRAFYPNKFTIAQYGMLDGNVIKKGQTVHSGDPIILAIKKKNQSPEVMRLGKMASRLANPYGDAAVTWTKDYPGEVIEVVKNPAYIKVIIRAVAPMVIGDKICGRFGNKGVVTRIVPDNEAPRMLDGTIPDVYMNPAGIPSRMNLGQVYETALAKVIDQKKLGSLNYKNFTKSNTFQEITDLMKKHGVSDTETMYDPVSGRNIPKVFTGKQYFMKLFKQTEVNYSARAGGEYDIDQRPVRGGDDGSKSLGALDFYGMLAHNSRSLLREAATAKAEYNPEVWKSILSGKPLPPPKSTFAFDKVMTMIKGMGVNIKKEGNSMKATPFIDKDILALSKGEIKEATMTMEKPDPETGLNYRPEKGGLFDPAITGGLTGSDWGHIHLATPVVNQMFEKPIRALLDMKQKDFTAISDGKMHISVDGTMQTGGDAIKGLLNKIDVNSELKRVQGELSHTTSAIKRDPLLKKQKTLSVLQANNMHPAEAYIMHNIPVIPPKYRPVYPKETGEIVTSDANHLYREIINLNNQLKSPLTQASGKDSDRYKALHTELTTSVKKMQGIDGKTADVKEREPAGFMDIIKGKGQPKYGYFQGKLLARAQDLVGRGTIAPDPTLGIDECALPEPMCWTLYGPFVIGQFVRNGYDLPKAQNEIRNRTMAARNLLQAEMNKRPCILNRAPTLHKFGMMAFTPQMTQGRTIKICPLIVKGFGADFDGDSTLNSMWTVFKPVFGSIDKERYVCYPID